MSGELVQFFIDELQNVFKRQMGEDQEVQKIKHLFLRDTRNEDLNKIDFMNDIL